MFTPIHNFRYWLIMFCAVLSFDAQAQLKANFTLSSPKATGCTYLQESYKNATSGASSAATYLWKLGNGNKATTQDASAIYVNPKTYYITLIVTDGNKVDSVTKSVTIFNGPTANFSVAKTAGCSPFTISITDNSSSGSAPISKYLWDFGDGNTSSDQSPPPHSYSMLNTYKVSLYLTDTNGCPGSYHFASPIVVGSPPVVNFSSNSGGGCAPTQSIKFTAKVSSSFGGFSYNWNFGDGSNPATVANPTHDYIVDGNFEVKLTVTDSTGCIGTADRPGYIYIGNPIADFLASATNGCAPFVVDFTDISTGVFSGASFSWDFGDGNTSTSQFPVHTYAIGTYDVKETVTNPTGCTNSVTKTSLIHVTKAYTASFSADTVLCQLPFITTLINTSGANTKVLYWDYGDSTKHDTASMHRYPDKPPLGPPQPPTSPFTITMVVIDDNQCVETLTKSDYIYAWATTAAITASPPSGCVPLTVSLLSNISTYDPVKTYSWKFSKKIGDTSNVKNPGNRIYNDTGTFDISLMIETDHGCKVTALDSILAGDKPPVSFIGGPDSGCLNNMRNLKFISTSNDSLGPNAVRAESYAWTFTEGRTAYTPVVTFTSRVSPFLDDKPGVYGATLITTNHGCNDTLIKKNLIKIVGPWSNFAWAQKDPCNLSAVTFTDKSLDNNHVEYFFGDNDTATKRNLVHIYKQGTFNPYMIVKNDTSGCTDTFKYNLGIVIPQPWTVTFKDSLSIGCIPFTNKFFITSNDSTHDVIYFGNGDSTLSSTDLRPPKDTLQKITYVYQGRGIDTVKLKSVNSATNCIQKIVITPPVKVGGPLPKFIIDKNSGCVPLKIRMIEIPNADSSIISRAYNMGDGTILKDTADTMFYTFKTPPTNQNWGYTNYLTESDPLCTNFYSQIVYPSQPIADFTIDSGYTCTTTLYIFTPTDSGLGPFNYLWDFGDGSAKSNQRNPVYGYAKNGTYKVTLKMTDMNGCADTISKILKVKKSFSKANFSYSTTDLNNCPPYPVNFIDKSHFVFGGYTGYEWDFGDGSPHVFTESPSKVYFLPGSYTVSLKITDSLGCQDSITIPGIIKIKGAVGSYSESPHRGCVPLTVNFTALSKNAKKFTWDAGDGNIDTNAVFTNTYVSARNYTPVLILSDSFNCSYALPIKDTIIVDSLPTPDFVFDSICSGFPTFFYDRSVAHANGGTLVSWSWDFGDSTAKSSAQNPTHVYKKNGTYDLGLTVTNSHGCVGMIIRKIKIGGIIAGFKSPATSCVGTINQFTDTSKSDTAIKSRLWHFGDGDSSTSINPTHMYVKKGLYTVSLFAENYKACTDSLIRKAAILVGDTIPPPPPVLYRVTVASDTSVEIDFSKFIDVDFHSYIIYMEDINGNFIPVDSTLNLNDTVINIGKLNTLKNVYCFNVQSRNICGHYSLHSPVHCSMDVTARPGVDEALISWTPYVGWNVLKYQVFRKSYYSNSYIPLNFVGPDTLQYIDSNIICYKPVTYKIKAYESGGYGQFSWSDTSTTLPVHIPKLPNPQLIDATVPDNRNVLIEWSNIPSLKVRKWILEKSYDGVKYNILDTPFNSTTFSYYDSKADVHNNSYSYRLSLMDSCGDISEHGNIAKTILLKADTTQDVRPILNWTAYRSWPEGVRYYEIDFENTSGKFDTLGRTKSGSDTTFIDYSTDLNSLPQYCYRVIAHRNGPPSNPDQNLAISSISNVACIQAKTRVFVPNAFTPNNDGLNDSLDIKGLFINEYHIRIYDRWGTLVFESHNIKDSWNGSFKGAKPINDVYKYLIDVKGVDNNLYFFQGNVTVLP